MKKYLLTTAIVLAITSIIIAATLTIEIPTPDETRIKEAYGSILGLGRPATLQEIDQALTLWLESSTQSYERTKYVPPPMGVAKEAHSAKAASPTPTAKPNK